MSDFLDIAGKVVLVTGASRGIGRAAAELFAEHGAHVAVNFVSDHKAATDVVAQCERNGIRAVAVQGDVSKVADGARVVNETLQQFGRLDFLICNAGIWEGNSIDAGTSGFSKGLC